MTRPRYPPADGDALVPVAIPNTPGGSVPQETSSAAARLIDLGPNVDQIAAAMHRARRPARLAQPAPHLRWTGMGLRQDPTRQRPQTAAIPNATSFSRSRRSTSALSSCVSQSPGGTIGRGPPASSRGNDLNGSKS